MTQWRGNTRGSLPGGSGFELRSCAFVHVVNAYRTHLPNPIVCVYSPPFTFCIVVSVPGYHLIFDCA